MKYIIVIRTSNKVEVKSYEKNQKITLNEWQSLFGGEPHPPCDARSPFPKQAFSIEPKGSMEKVAPQVTDEAFGEGRIECVPSIFPGIEIIIDEEGKHKGLPTMRKLRYNAIATGLLHPSIADVLVGDAVLAAVKKDSLDGMSEFAKEFIVKQICEAINECHENKSVFDDDSRRADFCETAKIRTSMNEENKDSTIRETLGFEVTEE